MPSRGVARKDKIAMNLFGRQSKTIASIIGTLFLSVLIVACGSSNGGSTSTVNGNNGKGCMKIGVLLPETATSYRWDSVDRPDLQRDIPATLPGATVDYANAQGNADQQKTQADAALTKGDCILVVAPSDAVKASAIVAEAKADNVPVITYDRLIQSNDLAAYVSFDGVAVGELQGQYIFGHYKKFVQKSGGNVAMINRPQKGNKTLLFPQRAHHKLRPPFCRCGPKKL